MPRLDYVFTEVCVENKGSRGTWMCSFLTLGFADTRGHPCSNGPRQMFEMKPFNQRKAADAEYKEPSTT